MIDSRRVLPVKSQVELMECGKDSHCWGPRAWSLLKGVCDMIPCPTCQAHCYRMVKFEHDLVNVHLGKPIFDAVNFSEYLGVIANVSETAKLGMMQ